MLEAVPLAVPGLTAMSWAAGAIEARDRSGPRDRLAAKRSTSSESPFRSSSARPQPAIDLTHLAWAGQSMPLADFFRGRRYIARLEPEFLWSATRAASSGLSAIGSPIGSG